MTMGMSEKTYVEYAREGGYPWVEVDPGWLQDKDHKTPKNLAELIAGADGGDAELMFYNLYRGWLRRNVPKGFADQQWNGDQLVEQFDSWFPAGGSWQEDETAAGMAPYFTETFGAFRSAVEELRKFVLAMVARRANLSPEMAKTLTQTIGPGAAWDETFARLQTFLSYSRDEAIASAVVAAGYYEQAADPDPARGYPDGAKAALAIKKQVVRAQEANSKLRAAATRFKESVEAGLEQGIEPKDSGDFRSNLQSTELYLEEVVTSVGELAGTVYKAAYDYYVWAVEYTRKSIIKGARTEMPLIWAAVQASEILFQAAAFAITFTPAAMAAPVFSLGAVNAKLWGNAIIGMKAGIDAQNDEEVKKKLGYEYKDHVGQLKDSMVAELGIDDSVQKAAAELNEKYEFLQTAVDVVEPVADYAVEVAGVTLPAAIGTAGSVASGALLVYKLVDTAHQVVDAPELVQVASDDEIESLHAAYDASKGAMRLRGQSGATISIEGKQENGYQIRVGSRTGLLSTVDGCIYWDDAIHHKLWAAVGKAEQRYNSRTISLSSVPLEDGTCNVALSLDNVYARNSTATEETTGEYQVTGVDCEFRTTTEPPRTGTGLADVTIDADGHVSCEVDSYTFDEED